MIHEIFPHSFNNRYLIIKDIAEDDYIFHYNGNSLLLKTTPNGYEIPRKKDLPGISGTSGKNFLFSFDKVPCFLVLDLPETLDSQLIYKEIANLRKLEQKEIIWVGQVGFQLMKWLAQNKYCGKCGAKTIEKQDERAIICPVCNTTVFPSISPAIIVAITCNDKILLANGAGFSENWYSLIAGYADIGELLEETVIREVREEVGLDVSNIRYYKSQPWPFSGSMMVGYFAEADGSQEIKVDNREITRAAWFTRGSLPNHPTNISIAGEMIDRFEKNEL
jgi:NAD+ diphosphatase